MERTEVHEAVLPKFSEEYKDAMVIEGDEVLIVRPEERGTQNILVNTDKIPRGKWRPLSMFEDWVVLCQALYQSGGEEELTEMHEKSKEV